ncbi:unnamed protein product [Tilletia controversa]|nr:unnamed protein product [Tilletia controversa]CAD6969285.1 unnamed protein product [Tilletia controversa]
MPKGSGKSKEEPTTSRSGSPLSDPPAITLEDVASTLASFMTKMDSRMDAVDFELATLATPAPPPIAAAAVVSDTSATVAPDVATKSPSDDARSVSSPAEQAAARLAAQHPACGRVCLPIPAVSSLPRLVERDTPSPISTRVLRQRPLPCRVRSNASGSSSAHSTASPPAWSGSSVGLPIWLAPTPIPRGNLPSWWRFPRRWKGSRLAGMRACQRRPCAASAQWRITRV